jgi:EF hand domain-containing protein
MAYLIVDQVRLSISRRSDCMRTKLIVIALAAAFPLGAYAQGTKQPDQQQRPGASSPTPAPQGAAGGSSAGGSHSRLDINRDGKISREEAKASSELSSRFNELDKNRDGSLTAEELSSSGGGSPGGPGSAPMKR